MLKRPTFYLALIGIIAITALVMRLRKGDPVSTPLVTPSSSPYERTIGARGIVESLRENVRVSPFIGGRIDKVFVKVGDKVQRGQPLFQIDSREVTAELELAEKQVAVLESSVKTAEVDLADRQEILARMIKLSEKRVASEDERQRDIFAFRGAQARLDKAKADLEYGIAQRHLAKTRLDLLTVYAPRDGEVLQVNVREGEFAPAAATTSNGEPAILLGDVASLQLRADVDEADAPRVRPGTPAVAYLKGTRSEPIDLKFVRIEPYILPKRSLTGESTERVDTRVLQIVYQFEKPAFPIYVGQQMDVFIDEAAASPPQRAPGSPDPL